jgi:hypothetical protein
MPPSRSVEHSEKNTVDGTPVASSHAADIFRLPQWVQSLPAYRHSAFAVAHVHTTLRQDGWWNRIFAQPIISPVFPTIRTLHNDGMQDLIVQEVESYLRLVAFACAFALCIKDALKAIHHQALAVRDSLRIQGTSQPLVVHVGGAILRGVLACTLASVVSLPRILGLLYSWGASGGALAEWHAQPISLRLLCLGLLISLLVDGLVNAWMMCVVIVGITGLMGYWL